MMWIGSGKAALALTVALMVAGPALAADNAADNAAVNAVYGRLSAVLAAQDADGYAAIYAPEATYLSGRDTDLPLMGRDRIMELFGPPMRQAREKGIAAKLDFRLLERKWLGDVAVDTGITRFEFKGPDGQPRISNSKFMTVAKREPDGRWVFVADAAATVKAEEWDKAQPVANLKYDG